MQSLTVENSGILYLFKALMLYSGGCMYFIIYVASLLYVIRKKSGVVKNIFIPQAVMLLFTVFNPVFPVVLNHVFDVNKEYYRFFWIAPVVILTAYVLADIIGDLPGFGFVAAFITAVCFIMCAGNYIYAGGYVKTSDIYRMPSEISGVCDIIHRDAGTDFPRAVCEFDYEMCLRQYDASIMLVADREQYLNVWQNELSREEILSEEAFYNRVIAVVAKEKQLPVEDFLEGLEKTATEYVVISKTSRVYNYVLRECALSLVGETANHAVFKYELKESRRWELPDYSDVWENY